MMPKMYLHQLKILAMVGLSGLSGGHQASAATPSRSECITVYTIDWTDIVENYSDVLNRIPRLNRATWHPNLAAIVIGDSRKKLYLQFTENCDQRWRMAEQIISQWRELDRSLPAFVPDYTPVVPSPFTIDVQGKSWRD
jgi:hypothetical protein